MHIRSRIFDSARWAGWRPRPDDIIIATYPKCGTTWVQRIVGMLVLGTTDPLPINDISPWPDMRLFGPPEPTIAAAEAQTHRRFFKTHMPREALPPHPGVKVIHVGRDGRDAALSLHGFLYNFNEQATARLNAISRADPKFGDDYPAIPADPAAFFADWVAGGSGRGDEGASFFNVETSWWASRADPNLLFVHFNDLLADREAEMRRIAAFLGIAVPESRWPQLSAAASFTAMRAEGAALLPHAARIWAEGADRFLYRGTNGRWRGVFAEADLARYDAEVARCFPPALAAWIAHGRRGILPASASGDTP